ncbi:MAG: TetR/AcrR family transcriptional regulator [Opitutaceae bacterium]|jgi:TetR/AcrR family transcriptional regulator, transcriptional repressor for nem operon|nr:TetR/AcrR family transcriptional regulator [Opitutaceae bacterium]
MARPPQFDRTEVLEKATQLFWERGYRGASVSDLVKATGLLPGSIYASFGNKEGMFIACLDYYGAQGDALRSQFESDSSPLTVLRNFFFAIVEMAADGDGSRGCFLVNASLECAESDSAIKSKVRDCMGQNEVWIRDQIDAARQVGELSEDTDTTRLAGCLTGAMFGFRVMSRAQEDPDKIRDVASTTFDSLVTPWQQVAV